jgi:nucleotide-binding universal stress UspA family protein
MPSSDHAFKAFQLAITIAKQNSTELRMICVEELPIMPEFIEEIREMRATAARRFHTVMQRARALSEEEGLPLHTHTLAGHPVRTIVELARELGSDLLVIGATGHSALYERTIGSRADRIIQLAPCPVLIVK